MHFRAGRPLPRKASAQYSSNLLHGRDPHDERPLFPPLTINFLEEDSKPPWSKERGTHRRTTRQRRHHV